MNRTRNLLANVLIVLAVAIAAWWLLRGVFGFIVGIFWFLVAAGLVIGVLYLAGKVRGSGGNT
jgi:hypothetical protein